MISMTQCKIQLTRIQPPQAHCWYSKQKANTLLSGNKLQLRKNSTGAAFSQRANRYFTAVRDEEEIVKVRLTTSSCACTFNCCSLLTVAALHRHFELLVLSLVLLYGDYGSVAPNAQLKRH